MRMRIHVCEECQGEFSTHPSNIERSQQVYGAKLCSRCGPMTWEEIVPRMENCFSQRFRKEVGMNASFLLEHALLQATRGTEHQETARRLVNQHLAIRAAQRRMSAEKSPKENFEDASHALE